MSNNIDFDSIRRQIDIVNVISSYIPLSPTGRNFKGICPFHNDSNPSMMVSPDKQIYKCFSCGASGNVFTFIMNYEKVSFIEAVRKACNIQGINIPEVENAREVKKVDNKDQRQIKLMDDLTEFYHYQLLMKQ
jgi:DNA primase